MRTATILPRVPRAMTPWLAVISARAGNPKGAVWIIGRAADSFISHGQVVHPGDVLTITVTTC